MVHPSMAVVPIHCLEPFHEGKVSAPSPTDLPLKSEEMGEPQVVKTQLLE